MTHSALEDQFLVPAYLCQHVGLMGLVIG
jgi:hypothetical protein